jgi:hypothetical protein
MRGRDVKAIVLAAVLVGGLGLLPSAAQQKPLPWGCNVERGECFGTITLRVLQHPPDTPAVSSRVQYFSNGEILFEELDRSPRREILFLRDRELLFRGVSSLAEAEEFERLVQRGPNGRLTYGVFIAMVAAFPDGEPTVPAVWTTRAVTLGGAATQITVRRDAPRRIQYRFEAEGWKLEGEWALDRPTPLPDDYSLTGWMTRGAPPPATLGELRRKQ